MKLTKNSWKYLFWLGPCLIVAGIAAGTVSGQWQPLPLGLMVAGVVAIGLWLLYAAYVEGFWGRRSTQVSTNAILATVSVLLILGLINFMAVRYVTRFDLTESQQFSLAPQTREVLKTLKQPVKVWVFDTVQNPKVKELLENYQRLGDGKFSYEFLDPLVQPGKAREFGITNLGEVYLEAGSKRQLIQKGGSVFASDPSQSLSEVKLTNGLEEILSTRSPKIYFVQGQNERPLEEAQGGLGQADKALRDKSYTTLTLNFAEGQTIPEDADTIVVAGPQKPLPDAGVQALKAYLDRGGSMMVMIDPTTNSGLEGLLQEWGVKLDNRLAIDASGNGQRFGLGPTVPLIRNYGDHPITQSFSGGTAFFPFSRPVEVTKVSGIEEKSLIVTSNESWGESDLTSRKLDFDPKSDRQGPLILGVALTRGTGQTTSLSSASPTPQASPTTSPSPSVSPTTSPSPSVSPTTSPSPSVSPTTSPSPSVSPTTSPSPSVSPTTSPSPSVSPTTSPSPSVSPTTSPSPASTAVKEARMVVFGNSQFATNGWFEQQLNGDVFLNSISWLSKPDLQTFSIRPKRVTNRRIDMTIVQAGGLVLAWLIWPLIGLGIGGFLWWQRR